MNKEWLKQQQVVARGIIRAPDIKPGKDEVSAHEVIFTHRPSWSNIGKYDRALPGGGFKIEDFQTILSVENYENPDYIPTAEEMKKAGSIAVERELVEELGEEIGLMIVGLLTFVLKSKNKQGWTTYVYAADLEKKPDLLVKSDSAGTIWMNQRKLLQGRPRQMLSGNATMARKGINYLDSKKENRTVNQNI